VPPKVVFELLLAPSDASSGKVSWGDYRCPRSYRRAFDKF